MGLRWKKSVEIGDPDKWKIRGKAMGFQSILGSVGRGAAASQETFWIGGLEYTRNMHGSGNNAFG